MLLSVTQRRAIGIVLAGTLSIGGWVSAEDNIAPVVAADEYAAPIFEPDPVDDDQPAPVLDLTEEADLFFAQVTQPPDVVEAQPAEPEMRAPPPPRRRRTYRLPPMFGDIFGGGTSILTVQPPNLILPQTLVDGVNANFNVFNRNGGAGADNNPAVVIEVRDPGNNLIAMSVGPGVDSSLDGQPDTYQISEPQIAGISPPNLQGGTIVFNGGQAIFVGGTDPADPSFGPRNGSVNEQNGWALDFSHTFTPGPLVLNIPRGGGGGAAGREKIAENNSPDTNARMFYSYSYFNNVRGGIGDVNRNTVGMEQPFADNLVSLSVRIPFAGTIDVDQVAGGSFARNTQFGDVAFIGKVILYREDDFLVSGGSGVTIPTGDDARVFLPNGAEIVNLENRGVHFLPFLAMLHGYDSGWYWQGFVQLDVPANGNPLQFDPSLAGNNLQRIGVLQDQTLLFVDAGIGYWLFGGPLENAPGVAATAEIHYTTTLQDADTVAFNGLNIQNAVNRFDVVNLTLGLNVAINERINIRPAMVMPLNDDLFDYEAMVQANIWR